MKNLAFVGNGEPPHRLLEIWKKFTPGNSGIWGNLRGVDNYKDADYFGVIDGLPGNVNIPEEKCVFLGAHPESMHVYQNMSGRKGWTYDCRKTFGFGEWWLKYDYDYLNSLQPPTKIKDLACIMSDADTQIYHKKRREFVERFCTKYSNKLDLYGRIKPWGPLISSYKGSCGNAVPRGNNDHMYGKEKVYEDYKYALEFDATGKFYFSERVFDCLLMWCMPLYWGGEGLHTFIPSESFRYIKIDGQGDEVINALDSNLYEKSLPFIKEARNLLLNRYQLWPRIHEAIFGVPHN